MVQRKICVARKTLKNDALDAKIGVDRAANEPRNRKNRRPCYRESESTVRDTLILCITIDELYSPRGQPFSLLSFERSVRIDADRRDQNSVVRA